MLAGTIVSLTINVAGSTPSVSWFANGTLIAFGPTAPEEIRPFLARVLRGIPIPPERVEEVVHHYEAVGGKSPLNEITF